TLPPPGSGHRRRAARGRVHVRPHAGSRVGAIRRRAPRPAREELGTAPRWHRDPDHPRLALRLVGPIAGARGVAPPAPGRRPRPRDAVVAHARRALRRARSQLLLGGARAAPRRHARRPEGRAPALRSRARDRGAPGLGFWDGDATVRLLEADDALSALLLEACQPGTPLRERPDHEQDAVVASLLRRMWRTPPEPHGFLPLSELTAHWAAETLGESQRFPDAGLVREGLRLFRELP